MLTSDFDFDLPEELIAQFPAGRRTDSRLLCLDGNSGAIADACFRDIVDRIHPGDLLVFNNTKVIKARLLGEKDSGGKVEVLVERIMDQHRILAHVKASHAPKAGGRLRLAGAFEATVLGRHDDLFELYFNSDTGVLDLLDRHGKLPLPPYITHSPDASDDERYQTVYASQPGAVAAPTAGLHFDEALLQTLAQKGVRSAFVTLHIGAGTFQPVRVEQVDQHKMHSEWYQIPEETVSAVKATQLAGGKVTAVGSTAMRALESAAQGGELQAGSGDTDIFITPGYRFRVVERLMTNFHLPRSTLVMLVSAFAGTANIQRAYRHAVAQRYRFFSYGDAMLLERQDRPSNRPESQSTA
ncbi:MAG: tRNA preQ1(34) S-adenosylmethionine ribosyltransferase-isomerase QueA [Methylobacterium sp.]|nr:tRNA preQ1(34) S-adenosylmethionine ribosyltransferase-isomerase QueA [Methylobacterium sp.]